jgi:hypothetical protein
MLLITVPTIVSALRSVGRTKDQSLSSPEYDERTSTPSARADEVIPRGKPSAERFFRNHLGRRHTDILARLLCPNWRHASRRGISSCCESDSGAARAAPRLGRKTDLAGAAVRARASRNDVYRTTHRARHSDWTLRRRQSYWRRSDGSGAQAFKFRNPFAFWTIIGFALFLGAVIVVGRLVGEWLGGIGAIIGAAVVGLVDVDAITVSVAGLTPAPLGIQEATIAILSAVATNTISKIAIGGIIGRGRFALEIIAMALACFTAGALALWTTWAILYR